MYQSGNCVPLGHIFKKPTYSRARAALLAASCLLAAPANAIAVDDNKQITIREMIGKPVYWPPECSPKTCVLTGNGGIKDVWLHHVEENSGKIFVVKGRCASACEWAYLHARARGEKTVVLPGAHFLRHNPLPAKWR